MTKNDSSSSSPSTPELEAPAPKHEKTSNGTDTAAAHHQVLHKKGQEVAVHCEGDDLYWIALLKEDIFTHTSDAEEIEVSYLNHPDERSNVYSFEMDDTLQKGAIICPTQLAKLAKDLFYLSDSEHRRIVNLLKDQLAKWEEDDDSSQGREAKKLPSPRGADHAA